VHTIRVPYHLDEHLPSLRLPLPPGRDVTASLPQAGIWERLAVLYDAVAHVVAEAAGGTQMPVVLSGDCTTSLGIMAGLQRTGTDAGIVWFDAHGDVQTPETTSSGYLAGMALRLLMGHRPELIASRLGLRAVAEGQVVLAGARDLDPPEAEYLAGSAIVRRDVAALSLADLPDGPLYLHLDLDVVDPAELAGLRFPAPGGPGPTQVADALRLVLGTGRVAAAGIACAWRPGHDEGAEEASWLGGVFA
jgi:arginase